MFSFCLVFRVPDIIFYLLLGDLKNAIINSQPFLSVIVFTGKDLHWYARDKKSRSSNADALKEEMQRIKEDEEQAMRKALGLAPKRSSRPQGNRLDKHEYSELVKRGSTVEDLGAGHAKAARVDGLGFSR
jgi:hypothetical protein